MGLAVKRGTSCDVLSGGTYCINSNTVGVCIPDNGNGMNPGHWSSYTCPDADETCEYVGGQDYGCVGVSDNCDVFFTNCDQYGN